MTVAVYAVMRDEQANIAQWAETTLDADFRFVLDTGSSDDTRDELRTHGIPFVMTNYEPFRFDDARNAALALLPTNIDWCLQLDADETLNGGWRDSFEAVCDPRIPRYRYRWENHGMASWGLVMRSNFHRRHGFRWQYPCHEVLVPNAESIQVPRMVVEHHPDETKSRDFYLDLLQDGYHENPHDHRMAFYLGRELAYRGLWKNAREQLVRFLDMPGGWAPERAEAWRLIAWMDDDPERWLWKAVGECPARRETWCDLARLYLRNGDPVAARMMIPLAARRDDEQLYTTSRDCWGEGFEALADECAVRV